MTASVKYTAAIKKLHKLIMESGEAELITSYVSELGICANGRAYDRAYHQGEMAGVEKLSARFADALDRNFSTSSMHIGGLEKLEQMHLLERREGAYWLDLGQLMFSLPDEVMLPFYRDCLEEFRYDPQYETLHAQCKDALLFTVGTPGKDDFAMIFDKKKINHTAIPLARIGMHSDAYDVYSDKQVREYDDPAMAREKFERHVQNNFKLRERLMGEGYTETGLSELAWIGSGRACFSEGVRNLAELLEIPGWEKIPGFAGQAAVKQKT